MFHYFFSLANKLYTKNFRLILVLKFNVPAFN
jgi:hypothetical protein